MQTKEINKIAIKPVVHLALESHEILGWITSRRYIQIFNRASTNIFYNNILTSQNIIRLQAKDTIFF